MDTIHSYKGFGSGLGYEKFSFYRSMRESAKRASTPFSSPLEVPSSWASFNAKVCFCFNLAASASKAALLVSSLMWAEDADDVLERTLRAVDELGFDTFDTLSSGDNSSCLAAAPSLRVFALAFLHHEYTL